MSKNRKISYLEEKFINEENLKDILIKYLLKNLNIDKIPL